MTATDRHREAEPLLTESPLEKLRADLFHLGNKLLQRRILARLLTAAASAEEAVVKLLELGVLIRRDRRGRRRLSSFFGGSQAR